MSLYVAGWCLLADCLVFGDATVLGVRDKNGTESLSCDIPPNLELLVARMGLCSGVTLLKSTSESKEEKPE